VDPSHEGASRREGTKKEGRCRAAFSATFPRHPGPLLAGNAARRGIARGWDSAHARENYPFSRADRYTRLLSRSPGSRDERALRASLKAAPDSEPRPSPPLSLLLDRRRSSTLSPLPLDFPLALVGSAQHILVLSCPVPISISRGILSRPTWLCILCPASPLHSSFPRLPRPRCRLPPRYVTL